MRQSAFLNGLLQQSAEVTRSQLAMWNDAKLLTVLMKRIDPEAKLDKLVDKLGSSLGLERKSDHISPAFIHPIDPSLQLLCKLLDHIDRPIVYPPTRLSLIEDGLALENAAVACLREFDGKRFQGRTLNDMVRHVVKTLFEDLEKRMMGMPPDQRTRVAQEVLGQIEGLDEETVRKIIDKAGVSKLSVDAVLKSGAVAGIGAGLATAVGVANFTAYTTLTTVIAGVAGAVGVTLPFGFYVTATSFLAFATNPLVIAMLSAIGGVWFERKITRQMQTRLLPVIVATAVITPQSRCEEELDEFSEYTAARYRDYCSAEVSERKVYEEKYPAFKRA